MFAIDPSISRQLAAVDISEITISLPWDGSLTSGPVDEYIEVVDVDPASQAFYAPVDLNHAYLLAQDGLTPSESNPQFHQQMVYAVARTTIRHFERALGRKVIWSIHREKKGERWSEESVSHLRIYPHAMREANAYYSPEKKALLFGYFPAAGIERGEGLPGETVFSCLSYDIIAHETTHALLDGLHRRFIEPSNADVLALHEGFADLVALFQHFTHPEVLRHQIARTRGDLARQNLLGELAVEFGMASGLHGALRSAIGRIDPQTREWVPGIPDPQKILHASEPHVRGSILVAAVFDTFLAIYKSRIVDLLRIASGGTGLLPDGDLHPDLVNRLAGEASKSAEHMLNICIRAWDYMAPVDPDFGDFLRAMITADVDMVADDKHHYRVAILESFSRHGLYPKDVRHLDIESLLWHKPTGEEQRAFQTVFRDAERLHWLVPQWEPDLSAQRIYKNNLRSGKVLHDWFLRSEAQTAISAAQLVLDKAAPEALFRGDDGAPTLEVHSVRPSFRTNPEGRTITELVIEITQRRRGYLDPGEQAQADKEKQNSGEDFIFRGGCTLLVNPETAEVRYCIYKRIQSETRLTRMREFLQGGNPSLQAVYFGDPYLQAFQPQGEPTGSDRRTFSAEPLALLHREMSGKEAG